MGLGNPAGGGGGPPSSIAHRYEVLGELGRGGAAVVYRVREASDGRELALKQLALDRIGRHTRELAVLFQREFHTLAQLSHPRIIQVHDFGVAESGPYYTMELLDGGDLKSRSPLPYREACRLLYDVCSSLALIHSRGWVHRDVTPVNIRCTRDGRAKLIDFGAMVPMGFSELSVGTPSFTAPEVVQHSMLDARTDLFSLGATLYFVLTGKNAYAARSFAQLPLSWRDPPPPPSHFAEVPPGLDALVLSLLRPEPAARPRSAFEVMQRLAAIADVEAESESVSLAYLSTPSLVGREAALTAITRGIEGAQRQRGKSLLVRAETGLGRTRLLDACVLEAKMAGVVVLRSGPTRSADFAVAQKLVASLLEQAPEAARAACAKVDRGAQLFLEATDQDAQAAPVLRDLSDAQLPRMETHTALAAWLSEFARAHSLVVIVDDLERVDEPSIVLLAALASDAARRRLLMLTTFDAGSPRAQRSSAISALRSRSEPIALGPLDAGQMHELFRSIFGDVQNLSSLSQSLQRTSAGAPRVAMELAQHLVDLGRIRYRDGQWTLPSALDPSDLPHSAEDALKKRLAALSPLARHACEALVLSAHAAFTREDYALVFRDTPAAELDRALAELLANRVVTSDGAAYRLGHAGVARAVTDDLDDARRSASHRALVLLYGGAKGADAIFHLLKSGQAQAAVERAIALVDNGADTQPILSASRLPGAEVAAVFVAALQEAERLNYRPRALHELRRAILSFSVAGDEAHFYGAAPAWLRQLRRDSGLDAFVALADVTDGKERLKQALGRAQAAYLATPEAERVYPPPEAIRGLLSYAVASIAIGVRTQDFALLESLPALLAPFAGTSHIAYAIWQNCLATREGTCRGQQDLARARWLDVYRRLNEVSGEDMQRIELVRNGVGYGVASMSAHLGLSSANEWVDRIERDPRQRVNALYLRRITALQQGDWGEAEEYRKRAELMSLQSSARQMFGNSGAELPAHALAQDLVGVTQIWERLGPLAERWPGWRLYRACVGGYMELLRGDFARARAAFEACMAPFERGEEPHGVVVWLHSAAGLMETLLGLGALEESRALGERAIALCSERNIRATSFSLERALALVEAQRGDCPGAARRAEAVIAAQETLGVTGLQLGVSYETRARIALIAALPDDINKYALLAAREYRHGRGSPLAARYERLMEEARRFVRRSLPGLEDFVWSSASTSETIIQSLVTRTFRAEDSPDARARAALVVLHHMSGAAEGHLYVWDGARLSFAASVGGEPPPDLEKAAQEYLVRAGVGSDVTATITESGEAQITVASTHYRAVLLQYKKEEQIHCAGVLLLAVVAGRPVITPDLALLEAFSSKLSEQRVAANS